MIVTYKYFRILGKILKACLYISVFNDNLIKAKNHISDVFIKKTIITSETSTPIYTKIAKTDETGPNQWSQIKNLLYGHADTFNTQSVSCLTDGLTLKKITFYNRFLEVVHCFGSSVNEILTSIDFTHIINLCKTNEKFVFIMLYPYFIRPVGKIVWTTLLPHFHFVHGSFTFFMQKVSDLFKKGTNLSHTYRTMTVKRQTKLAIEFSSVGILALFNNLFVTKTAQGLISNKQLYKGLSGTLRTGMSLLRLEGSKVIFEIAKTFSTFSNAAIAGVLDPKQEVIPRLILFSYQKKSLTLENVTGLKVRNNGGPKIT